MMLGVGRVASVIRRTMSPGSSSVSALIRSINGRRSDGGSDKDAEHRKSGTEGQLPSLEVSATSDDDEFISIAALSEATAPLDDGLTPDSALQKLASAPADIAPHLAKALVERIVAEVGQAVGPSVVAPLTVTRHTMRVMLAGRIVTHDVITHMRTSNYPIAAKVTAQVDLDILGLSVLARVALEQIAGPRLRDNILTVNSNKYLTRAENQVHVVGLASNAIAQALVSVGENVDETPLSTWNDILRDVKDISSDDPADVQTLVDYLSSLPEPERPSTLASSLAPAVADATDLRGNSNANKTMVGALESLH
jgi:hypothetical protein